MGLWVHHDEEPSKHPTERVTADGVTVRVGDRVWIDRLGIGVRQTKLDRYEIGWQWSTAYEGKVYAAEAACVRAAIQTRKRAVAKARREIATATAYADKLRTRLRTLEKGTD